MTAGASEPVEGAGQSAARSAAAGRLPDRIAFLGFGLIGGSIALALREAGCQSRLVAWTPAGRGPRGGADNGVLDLVASSPSEAIAETGLVILAGPPMTVLSLLDDLAGPMRGALAPGATITDVASTKATIVARAGAGALPFVGGHPMAGRETSGFGAARPDLFVDRPWVIVRTPSSRPMDVERVRALAAATGARPMEMAADDHDAAVAAISHLPLILAAALVESVAGAPGGGDSWPLARALAAGGWADMTRLAKGDPTMGAGILATNGGPVAARLRSLRNVLDAWIEDVDPTLGGGDTDVLHDRLKTAREVLVREPEP